MTSRSDFGEVDLAAAQAQLLARRRALGIDAHQGRARKVSGARFASDAPTDALPIDAVMARVEASAARAKALDGPDPRERDARRRWDTAARAHFREMLPPAIFELVTRGKLDRARPLAAATLLAAREPAARALLTLLAPPRAGATTMGAWWAVRMQARRDAELWRETGGDCAWLEPEKRWRTLVLSCYRWLADLRGRAPSAAPYRVHWLFLDDLERCPRHERVRIADLVAERCDSFRPTVLACSTAPAAFFSEWPSGLTARIREGAVVDLHGATTENRPELQVADSATWSRTRR